MAEKAGVDAGTLKKVENTQAIEIPPDLLFNMDETIAQFVGRVNYLLFFSIYTT